MGAQTVTSLGKEPTLRLHITSVGNTETRITVVYASLTATVQTEYSFYTSHLTAGGSGKSVKPSWTGKQFQDILSAIFVYLSSGRMFWVFLPGCAWLCFPGLLTCHYGVMSFFLFTLAYSQLHTNSGVLF